MSTINIWAGWQKGRFHSNMKSSSWLLCYGVGIVQFFFPVFCISSSGDFTRPQHQEIPLNLDAQRIHDVSKPIDRSLKISLLSAALDERNIFHPHLFLSCSQQHVLQLERQESTKAMEEH